MRGRWRGWEVGDDDCEQIAAGLLFEFRSASAACALARLRALGRLRVLGNADQRRSERRSAPMSRSGQLRRTEAQPCSPNARAKRKSVIPHERSARVSSRTSEAPECHPARAKRQSVIPHERSARVSSRTSEAPECHPARAKRVSGPAVPAIVAGFGVRDSRSRQGFALRDDTSSPRMTQNVERASHSLEWPAPGPCYDIVGAKLLQLN
jgi:hypothetical protein